MSVFLTLENAVPSGEGRQDSRKCRKKELIKKEYIIQQ
jgi:hypothetical protein